MHTEFRQNGETTEVHLHRYTQRLPKMRHCDHVMDVSSRQLSYLLRIIVIEPKGVNKPKPSRFSCVISSSETAPSSIGTSKRCTQECSDSDASTHRWIAYVNGLITSSAKCSTSCYSRDTANDASRHLCDLWKMPAYSHRFLPSRQIKDLLILSVKLISGGTHGTPM